MVPPGCRVRWRRLALFLITASSTDLLLWVLHHAAAGWWLAGPSGGRAANPLEHCGALGVGGSASIKHPRRPWRGSSNNSVDLYVSFESDRLFATPLDGMEFDTASQLYVFYGRHDGKRGGFSAAHDESIWFQIDEWPRSRASPKAPFDLMGIDDDVGERARPLSTAALRPGCHSITVMAPGVELTKRFSVVDRPPAVWLITTAGVDHDLALLPHFIEHYRSAGIRPANMLFVMHSSRPDQPAVVTAKALMARNGIRVAVPWVGDFNTFDKFEIQVCA